MESVVGSNFSCSGYGLSRVNITNEAWTFQSEDPSHINSITALGVCQMLVMILGMPWNFAVFVTIIVKRHYSPTHIILCNLVVADLLLCLVAPFHIYSALNKQFSLGRSDYERCQGCQTVVIFGTMLNFVSIVTLALLSVDRLVFVKWPLNYSKYIRMNVCIFCLVLVWITSIVISVPPIFGFGEIKFSTLYSICSTNILGENHLTRNIYYIAFLAMAAGIPTLITSVMNVWLLLITCKNISNRQKRQRSNIRDTFHSFRTKRNREKKLNSTFHKEQMRLARTFGALFVVNLVTWFPLCSLIVTMVVLGEGKIPIQVHTAAYLSLIAQPTIHPVLETCLLGKAKSTILTPLYSWTKKFNPCRKVQ